MISFHGRARAQDAATAAAFDAIRQAVTDLYRCSEESDDVSTLRLLAGAVGEGIRSEAHPDDPRADWTVRVRVDGLDHHLCAISWAPANPDHKERSP